ncbi:protein-glutamine gamma-glutamyltransferase E-like [Plectropomus leopardus]|uniref:protein-glutamine gamma-glutamyltransferase E-like n=1 Tax=Plectropomus leopardus TaxID=160734 RepID=UPI001C4CB237|nr:protein-glutamine gamma-glutamyltransferase E-like [Plectropomus leopardus]
MADQRGKKIFRNVDPLAEKNNRSHHTSEISVKDLIVRRGQAFTVAVTLNEAFESKRYPLKITATMGEHASQELGTSSVFGIPDVKDRSPLAKAVWKVKLENVSQPQTGELTLIITPPADAPVGKYTLTVSYRDEEIELTKLALLFNAWCHDDTVFLDVEKARQEYVMNEHTVIYKGSKNYIFPLDWDAGQFEKDMVEICFALLDLSNKHKKDPAKDTAARNDPVYVGRVVSAMINSVGDCGVLEGRWGDSYDGGHRPGYWGGSVEILRKWKGSGYKPVKYGQCWVFAGVMCSVMRTLGIPTRIVTNFQSAHDTNGNLTIDTYHSSDGVTTKDSPDSVWNFHVWTESIMKRPDLSAEGKYDGWQVLDPTPQEMSDGVYCCGPAPVSAILCGQTDLPYDIPFVFAEVNADCVDWLIFPDGSQIKAGSFPGEVGAKISTKAIDSDKREDITNNYKYEEGSDKERSVFKYAVTVTKDYSETDMGDEEMEEGDDNEETEDGDGDDGVGETVELEDTEGEASEDDAEDEESEEDTETEVTEVDMDLPPVTMSFEEVTPPTNGKDVRVKLILSCSVPRKLSINLSVQTMTYNGRPAVNVKSIKTERELKAGKALKIPIRVPFSVYHPHMIEADSMKIEAIVMDLERTDLTYLNNDDIVLLDPPSSLEVFGKPKCWYRTRGQYVFKNPTKDETLKNCKLHLCGSGLLSQDIDIDIPDLKPGTRIRIQFDFYPYKMGKRTLQADFDCSSFRDIKKSTVVNVK